MRPIAAGGSQRQIAQLRCPRTTNRCRPRTTSQRRWRRRRSAREAERQPTGAAVDRFDRHLAGNRRTSCATVDRLDATPLTTDSPRARQWIASITTSLAADRPRARQWIASIATSLVVLAAAWWLYRSEANNQAEMPMPPWTRNGELAQARQARDKTAKPAPELATELALATQGPRAGARQDREAGHRPGAGQTGAAAGARQDRERLASDLATDLAEVKQALQQERDRSREAQP